MTMTDVQHHAEGIVAAIGALWTLLSVINGMLHNPEVKTAWGKLVDAASYISRKNAVGSVKAPFTMSKTESVEVNTVEATVTVGATVTKPAPEPEEVKP